MVVAVVAVVVRGEVEDDDVGKVELSVEEGVSKSLKKFSSSTVVVVAVVAVVVRRVVEDDVGKLELSVEEGVSKSLKNFSSSIVDENGTALGSKEAKLVGVVTATEPED